MAEKMEGRKVRELITDERKIGVVQSELSSMVVVMWEDESTEFFFKKDRFGHKPTWEFIE